MAESGAASHLGDALSALLDGELSEEAAAGARTHLAGCPECGAEMAAVSQIRSLLRDLPPVEPPADFYRRIRRPAAAVATPTPERPSERARPRRRIGVAALAACAAATLVVLGVAAPRDPETSPPVGRFIEAHATAAASGDPVSQMAPVVVPVSFRR